jgi:hypothetical protein
MLVPHRVSILPVLIYRRGNYGYVKKISDMILLDACWEPKGSREEAPMKRLNIAVMILLAFGFAGLAVSTASADIYAWTDKNGVRHFTNHVPPKQATLFMKTPEIPYDEEADNRRREMDRLAVTRQELAEREAFLLEQQQAAERRLEDANTRADEALREAERILQDAQAASENANYSSSSSFGFGYYYPYYRYKPHHHKKGHKRFPGDHYRKKHPRKHPVKHPLHDRYQRNHRVGSHYFTNSGRYSSHRSRVATFRGRHGRY